MPINYRKNNTNHSIEYYSDINDLNYSGLSTNKINIRVNNQINYIGLVNSSHEQASDLAVRVNNTNWRLAKKSLAPPNGLSYNSGQNATPEISSSVSYSPTLNVGTKITYSISPALPSGLTFNTSNGIISGTSPSTLSDTTHTITATNTTGNTITSFRIRVVYKAFTMVVSLYNYTPGQDYVLGYSNNTSYTPSLAGSSISNNSYKTTTIMSLFYRNYFGQINMDIVFLKLNAYNEFLNIKNTYTTNSFLQKLTINGTTYNVSSVSDIFVGQYNPDPSYFHLIYRWYPLPTVPFTGNSSVLLE